MCEVHYVGFNGYRQCFENENRLPKIITNWTCFKAEGVPKVCSHRFLITETKDSLKITGVVREDMPEILQVIEKPEQGTNFESCENFLIACKNLDILVRNFERNSWTKLDLTFLKESEKCFWDKILKFSFQFNDSNVILLLCNGSVWVLSNRSKLKMLYLGEVDKAVDISSGLEHSLILTESGCVLAFGNGSRGQLGVGDLNSCLEPIQILALEGLKVTKIAAGGWHSCAITDSGDLYMWGWNNCGQLSAFKDEEEINLTALPVLVDVGDDSDMRIVDVACGRRHTVAVLENYEIFSTGWNYYRQLGLNLACEKVYKFTKTNLQGGPNSKVICGPWYTILVRKLLNSETK